MAAVLHDVNGQIFPVSLLVTRSGHSVAPVCGIPGVLHWWVPTEGSLGWRHQSGGWGKGVQKEKLYKASCSQGQTGLCSCSGNAGWTRQALACFYCVRAADSTVPCGGRLGNFKSTIAGAPFADPAACCPTFKDGLHLKAAGELLLFNLLQYMW